MTLRTRAQHLLMPGLLVGLAAFLLAVPPQGRAATAMHAGLSSTKPASGSVLQSSPKRVILRFSEPVQIQSIDVVEYAPANGSAVAARVPNSVQTRGTDVIVTLERAVSGGVTVSWSVTSSDGHDVGGAMAFWCGTLPTEGRVARLSTQPSIAATIDGTSVGQRTVTYRTAMTSGSASWRHPLLPGPIVTPVVGVGRAARSTVVLALPGTWQLETTLLGRDGSVVLVRSAVIIEQ